MKFALLLVFGGLSFAACSNSNVVRPDSLPGAASASAAGAAQVSPDAGFGFNGTVKGFPTGEVFVSGGGTFDLATLFAKSSGGFSCLHDVLQGPLSTSINQNDPGPCLAGQGVRWDTAELLTDTTFKCTGAAGETLKMAKTEKTTDKTVVVLQSDFYRAGDANDESFTARMIVSSDDIAPEIPGRQNLWVQGVGCGDATVHFSR